MFFFLLSQMMRGSQPPVAWQNESVFTIRRGVVLHLCAYSFPTPQVHKSGGRATSFGALETISVRMLRGYHRGRAEEKYSWSFLHVRVQADHLQVCCRRERRRSDKCVIYGRKDLPTVLKLIHHFRKQQTIRIPRQKFLPC